MRIFKCYTRISLYHWFAQGALTSVKKYLRCTLVMGKSEGLVEVEEWHGHVTALSVRPESRRIGIAALLMDELEKISDKYACYFINNNCIIFV